TVKELAEAIKKTSGEVIKKLMKFGMMATLNQEIDYDTAAIIVEEFGITSEKAVVVTEEDILFDDTEDNEEELVMRAPVVVVMGHVDHGKTSLLDKIRSTSVVTGEAGGITQHIGAYTVKLKGRNITFLDTPGHEAFTTMRARGAQVTDIAILVVAADDGVMPQTVEAINHAKAAGVQIIVAINKIDKPGANTESVKRELSDLGLVPEEWGGSNVMVPVSALTGEHIDELLEMVLLTADIMDLKTNPSKQAKGTVIEARLDKNKGPVATVLVQRGTLKTGDSIVTGSIIGRVRAMTDDKGAQVKKAGPSIPVEVLGLPEVPEAGELFYAVEDEKVARQLAEKRKVKQRELQLKANSKMSLDTLYTQMAAGVVKDLNLIVKADVQGSVEAVTQSLEKISNGEVRVRVIHGAVGTITETDVRLAEVSNAIIIGFNVRPATNVAEMASDVGVDIRLYRIIYQAIEEVQSAMKGMLDKKFKEVVLGHVEIRQVFKVSGVGTIGGAYVTDGRVIRSCDVRLLRSGIVIHEGKLASLKRFKDDAREVAAGFECGISLEKYNDIKEGDIIEAFEMQEVLQA
ncbi:MAG: translation initiation factor IF-2, partial [Saccharofermentanales bacterium]